MKMPARYGRSCLFAEVASIAISRDFAWFMLGVVLAPSLLILTLACMVWSGRQRQSARSIPLALLIAAASGKDTIVTGWANSGMAGNSTLAYVIAEARDDSLSVAGAEG